MRKLFSAYCLFFFSISILSAQEKVDMQMMQKIRDEEKNNSQVTMIAHNITDVCGARLTNSPGYNRALDWVTQTLKQWGLENAGREAWGEFGRGWSTEQSYLAMKQPYYQPIIAYPVAWTNGLKKAVTSDVILLDKLDSANIDKSGTNLKGKFVMVKATNTKLRSAFQAYATRYDSAKLNTLPDTYMVTKAQLDYFLPFIQKRIQNEIIPAIKRCSRLADFRFIRQGWNYYCRWYACIRKRLRSYLARDGCFERRLFKTAAPVTR
jgi:hypothetical protein